MENEYQTNQTNPNQQIITVAQLEQMFQMFQQMNKQNQTIESSSTELRVAEKLSYNNYTTWCKFMHTAIKGRGRLSHIIDVPPRPSDPTYQQLKQRDSVVLS